MANGKLAIGTERYYFGRLVQIESVVQNRGRVYVRGTGDGSAFAGWVDVNDLMEEPDTLLWFGLRKADAVELVALLEQEDRTDLKDCLGRLKKALEG